MANLMLKRRNWFDRRAWCWCLTRCLHSVQERTRRSSWTMRFKESKRQIMTRPGSALSRRDKLLYLSNCPKKSCIHSVQEPKSNTLLIQSQSVNRRNFITNTYFLSVLSSYSRPDSHITTQSAQINQLPHQDSPEIAHPVRSHAHVRRNHDKAIVKTTKGRRAVSVCQAFVEGI